MIYDVLVVGGGTAGVIAAVQAARAGTKTLLVEKNAMLGGTMTVAGVNFPGLFHAESEPVIRGIGWELVTRSLVQSGGELPDFSGQKLPFGPGNPHWKYQIRIDRAAYAQVAEQAVLESGAELLLHTMPATLTWRGDAPGATASTRFADRRETTPYPSVPVLNRSGKRPPANVWEVTLCTKTGLQQHQARMIVDCTGDANAVSIAGFETRLPDALQPATLIVKVAGYDPRQLDRKALANAFAEAVSTGELQPADGGANGTGLSFVFGYGGNSIHIPGIDTSTSRGKTKQDVAGRACLTRLLTFYRRQPGLEGLHVTHMCVETGVRESRCIVGEKQITAAAYQSGALWEDALAYSYYPIDQHTDTGLDKRYLAPGIRPTIPLGAMLPRGAPSLMAAGRHIDGDRLAQSAFRVQASCMAMGQAAGAVAALAALRGIDPRAVPIADSRALLRRFDAIVPPRQRH